MIQYQAALTFNPNHVNRFRKGQLGMWRIAYCMKIQHDEPVDLRVTTNYGMLLMPVAKPYRPGVVVNPKKLLDEIQASRIDMIIKDGTLTVADK